MFLRKIDPCANKKNGICSVLGAGHQDCNDCDFYSSKALSRLFGMLKPSPAIIIYSNSVREMLEDSDEYEAVRV